MVRSRSAGCRECGARPRTSGARYCEYCGTELANAAASAQEVQASALRARFQRLRTDPRFEASMRPDSRLREGRAIHPATTASAALPSLHTLAGAGIFEPFHFMQRSIGCLVLGFLSFVLLPFLAPMGVLAIGGYVIYRALHRTTSAQKTLARLSTLSNMQTRPAHVAELLEEVAVGPVSPFRGVDLSERFTQVAILEFEDGQRRRMRVAPELRDTLRRGDVGIAHTTVSDLVGFRALEA